MTARGLCRFLPAVAPATQTASGLPDPAVSTTLPDLSVRRGSLVAAYRQWTEDGDDYCHPQQRVRHCVLQ